MSNLKNKVFIEGSNLASLTAAARLAKFKYQVTVSGQSYQNTQAGDFSFDYGPLFTLPAVYRDFFQKTGKHFGQVLEIKAMDPAFVFNFDDTQIIFANLSRNERLKEIESKLGKAAAIEWDRALKQAEYLWDKVRTNYFEWEFSYQRFNPDTYLRMRAINFQNPYLNRIMANYATYLGYPAGIYKWSHLLAFVEESFGIWQVTGGMQALTDKLKDRAEELGVIFANTAEFDYYIDATQTHNKPEQRLIGIENFPDELPVRTVQFHKNGYTTDIYATRMQPGKYSLVVTGKLDILEFEPYKVFDQIRPAIFGDSDNQVLTKIRTANKRKFKVRHMDSLAHAGITGELLANAVRGIKNRPSHEH